MPTVTYYTISVSPPEDTSTVPPNALPTDTREILDLLRAVDTLKSRLHTAPVVGSSARTSILLRIMSLQRRILALRESARDSKTTP